MTPKLWFRRAKKDRFAMEFSHFQIQGPVLVQGKVFGDQRGIFCETWREDLFKLNGIDESWQQDNVSISRLKNTIRGLHWQVGEAAQAKLVRPALGRILDVAVDLRQGSPTFGQAVAIVLDASKNQQLYVPEGFAHGFRTLEDQCVVAYKVSRVYNQAAERSLFWADPALAIDWGIQPSEGIVSDKDGVAPHLNELALGDLF